MRDEYLERALEVIPNKNILINLVSQRVRQLRRKNDSAVESLEHLELEDVALREIIEGKLTYELFEEEPQDDFSPFIPTLSS
ncbi:MAG: DNA-directed RNA polymerase subunit omega [Puniceicoccales bacterium]|jgi:DNA-directed RNA polymerase subunit omega|nr:DNA-directed RNA polymerase subunit omega [Puniceicoccales bacterium]